ncbi:hypothetical protein ACWZEH_01030 [Streptomyces sp. QTS137]
MTDTERAPDPIREALLAAVGRPPAGTPLRSGGRLGASRPAIEAGVER